MSGGCKKEPARQEGGEKPNPVYSHFTYDVRYPACFSKAKISESCGEKRKKDDKGRLTYHFRQTEPFLDEEENKRHNEAKQEFWPCEKNRTGQERKAC